MYGKYVGNSSRQAEALQSSRDALDVYMGLLDRVPNSPRFRSKIGTLHDEGGIVFYRMGRLEDAILEQQEARRILSELVRANPDVDEYEKLLALVCMRLGQYLRETKAPEQALGPLIESRAAFERLLGKNLEDRSSPPTARLSGISPS